MSTGAFSSLLRFAACRIGDATPYTAYSVRRGTATAAAVQHWTISEIQERLRHKRMANTIGYIEPYALFNLLDAS